MDGKRSVRAKHIDFIVIDIICIFMALIIAYLTHIDRVDDHIYFLFYRNISIVVIITYIVLMLFNSYHSNILKRGFLMELWKSTIVSTELILVIVAILFFTKGSEPYSRIVFGLFFIFNIVLLTIARTIRKQIIIKGFAKGKNVSRVMVATYYKNLEQFLDAINSVDNGHYKYEAIVLLEEVRHPDRNVDIDNFKGIPVIHEEDVLEFVKTNAINEAFILAKHGESGKLANTFLSMGIETHVSINMEMSGLSNVKVEQIDKYTTLNSNISPGTPGQLIVKRLFDVVVGIIGLIFTVPVLIIFAPIIKHQSPGPVFFKQDRVGKNGKIFKMYKFRSMYMDAEERKAELMEQNEMNGLMFKMENDPRIMPIGNFMRKTSLDEFPQFWNILIGDMSLVGTRPPTLDEYKEYASHHLSRLAMKPGLTGMWQTSGRSDITDFEEVVQLDNEYIRNFSLGLDIKIIVKTFGAVLKMKGSK